MKTYFFFNKVHVWLLSPEVFTYFINKGKNFIGKRLWTYNILKCILHLRNIKKKANVAPANLRPTYSRPLNFFACSIWERITKFCVGEKPKCYDSVLRVKITTFTSMSVPLFCFYFFKKRLENIEWKKNEKNVLIHF